MNSSWITLLFALAFLFGGIECSAGDADPLYRTCVKGCETTALVGDIQVQDCKFSGASANSSWQEPLYMQWKQLNCRFDCRYHCMMQRESERESLGFSPVKYHGKWPFKRVYVFQEPVSAMLSAFNLFAHLTGWLSFVMLVKYKLPLRSQSKRTYYEFTGLWHIYGLLSLNAWLWSAVFHTRDIDLTEKLDYSSAVALLGYSLILSILRTFNIKDEASRVMYSSPLLAFVTTHILFINFYKLDYGWNMKVCVVMGVCQLLAWTVWAGVSRHPSRFKLWMVVIGGALAMLLEIYDFPPYFGYVDAHALWHAATIPLTYLWWSFIRSDAEFRTSDLVRKVK